MCQTACPAVPPGDLNGDSVIGPCDGLKLVSILDLGETPTLESFCSADLNGNSKLEVTNFWDMPIFVCPCFLKKEKEKEMQVEPA